MHPERNWNRIQKSHPDHLAVGEAVTRAVYPALENPFAYPELAEAGLEAYKLALAVALRRAGRARKPLRGRHRTMWTASLPPSTSTSASIPTSTPWKRTVRGRLLGKRGAAPASRRAQRRGLPRRNSQRPRDHRPASSAPSLPWPVTCSTPGLPAQSAASRQAPSGAAATVGVVGVAEPPTGSTVMPRETAWRYP